MSPMSYNNQNVHLSIIIPTFRRPNLLIKTIFSCLNQTDYEGRFEIIVIDNSPEGSAKAILQEFTGTQIAQIVYLSEPQQNIALARNAGVSQSKGDLIVFIDDDEEASSNWLCSLVAAQQEYGADAVFGPTYPIFEEGTAPSWNPTASYYIRDTSQPTGTPIVHGATANVLVRRRCFVEADRWFDPNFGLTGGSDTEFFMRVHLAGKKFRWCAEAKVTEYIPKHRSTVRYILKRNFRANQTFVRCSVLNSQHPVMTSAYWMLVGLARVAIWCIPALLTVASDTPFSVRSRRRFVGAIGKIFWQKYFWVYFYAS